LIKENDALKKAAIVFGSCPPDKQNLNYFTLSESKNLKEAALNLFSILRELDENDCEVIITEILPEEGLGKAINDRLRRASN
jgi:L-threonylcarbamoyladenylate synthase